MPAMASAGGPEARDAATRAADPVPHAYWSHSAPDLLACLRTSEQGLDTDQAVERLARFGPNAVVERRDTAAVLLLVRQFASPLVLILVFGAGVSFLVR
ncbi:MAG: hypothetical protein KDH91_24300, partial [Rhodoferax sp.]|nr:hypothetical protein [Rhodoferax sp.]